MSSIIWRNQNKSDKNNDLKAVSKTLLAKETGPRDYTIH